MGERLVLSFHGLGPIPGWVAPDERPYWCDEDRFTSILNSIPQIAKSCDVPIEITFDDGNASDALIALPALADRGLSAAFFVCAGRIGQPGYLDALAMEELLSAGMRIGSHGWSHVDWRQVDEDGLTREVEEARRAIADAIGHPVDEVAIPFGSYDRRVLRRLRRNGFHTVLTSDRGRAPLGGWLVPRETYTVSWTSDSLHQFAVRQLSVTHAVKQSIVRSVKRMH
jgi:peptidoglycan/xylan/chitin deacetylase (PgdA/CDA1 family)